MLVGGGENLLKKGFPFPNPAIAEPIPSQRVLVVGKTRGGSSVEHISA
jgi:hypothetical protein